MKRTPLLTIWVLSFVVMILLANPEKVLFWIAFVIFSWSSLYIEKYKKRLKEEDE